ncbi:hypothetical protein [Granulicella mallensis]|uniref:YD repeat-containing protein n=1 Tax=Granulicella mallensis TaxID=940614 RepID=A0A7W7ZWQ1_9BACT|nr:hypothetical protein [Granulicella mallensis]MBB5066701.1 YD repeat-containing protein [Granulicella mallensis]
MNRAQHHKPVRAAEWAAMKSSGSAGLQRPGVASSRDSYDAQGRLVKVLEPDQDGQPKLETDYTYDDLGNIVTIMQRGKPGDTPRIRRFTYDQHSNLLSAISPEGGTITYKYDSHGYLVSTSDSRGITTNYTRDASGRLAGMQYSDGTPSVVYVYANDSSNQLISSYLDAPEGHKAERDYHYNAGGNPDLITQKGKENYTIGLGYDAAGHINQITYPDGRVVRQVWNQTGTLSSLLAQDGSAYFTQPGYTSSGALQSVLLGNGVTVQSS